MFKARHTYLLVLLITLYFKGFSTHIVGGEIYYDNLGGNNYRITMKVYRDCINGIPPFDNPAFMTIFDASNNVVMTLNVPLSSSLTVPPTNNSPCAPGLVGSACVEEAIYITTVNLPPKAGGYYIVYQRCCRNGSILNLISPGNVGTTYWEHIPGPEVVSVNSSPRFTKRPPIYICKGAPINFDHAATDADGDSLVYSLCNPFNGLDGCCPLIGTSPSGPSASCPSPPASCPTVNSPFPYASVPFLPPYTASYPLASSPAININPSSGYLSGNPTILGQWVVGVCVSEYRKGVLIAVHHRDFQFNVINCPFIVVADILDQSVTTKSLCNGLKISYSNNSFNGKAYFWDFGDPDITTDTSYKDNPTYTYNKVGTYTVTLIVNPGTPCSDTTTEVFHVYPLLAPDFTPPKGQCLKGNKFDFIAAGSFQGSGTFSWDFGPNATPSSANTKSVTGVSFNSPGTYTILLTVNENSCTSTATRTIEVYPNTKASLGEFSAVGCDPFTLTFPNLSTGVSDIKFSWKFSDGGTSIDKNPKHTFTPSGVYSVSLTAITFAKCIDTSLIASVNSITVNPSPVSSFTANPVLTTIFDPDISFFDKSSSDVISWFYDFDDGATSSLENPVHSYSTWNSYYVKQTVINNFGCPSSSELLVKVLPEFRFWIPNAFTPGNGDALNEVFKPVVIGVEKYTFSIFNRWGQQIFKTNDINAGWNGTYMGSESPNDVYVWKIEFRNIVTEDEEYHVGHVTLVR